jgi:hypothetical protein
MGPSLKPQFYAGKERNCDQNILSFYRKGREWRKGTRCGNVKSKEGKLGREFALNEHE